MEDYYLDEFYILAEEWAILHGAEPVEEFSTDDPAAFFDA